jgi:hypothetical protein
MESLPEKAAQGKPQLLSENSLAFSPHNPWATWYLGELNFQIEYHLSKPFLQRSRAVT